MPVTEHADGHTDGPSDDDVWHELAEHGLHHYTAQTANAVGTGPEAAWSEWADAPSAYIALECRLPDHPDRDAALSWTAEQGWAVAVETGRGEDLLITASLGGDVLPPPETVAAFVRAVLTGRHTDTRGRPSAAMSADLTRRLVDWAGDEPTLDSEPADSPRRAGRIAGVYAMLASDADSSAITGSVFAVDSGQQLWGPPHHIPDRTA